MNYKEYLILQQKKQSKNISVEKASKLMGKSPQFVRCGIRSGTLNIGTSIKQPGKTKYDYYINPTLLNEYLKENKKFDLYII